MLDQLADAGHVTARKMFGGVGLYCDGAFFGIMARDELYLRTDERTRPAFEARGCPPFKPYPHRPMTMKYYRVPLEVLESAPELVRWARASVAVANRTSSTSP